MPLPQQRTARLILLAFMEAIGPEELLELEEGYLRASPGNRRKFSELTNKYLLQKSVRRHFMQKEGNTTPGDE